MNRLKHYLKEIAIFIVVMTIFANILSIYKSSDLNNEALTLNSITLMNNELYSFKEDKPILIHFWATWCPTCKLEASNIEMISKQYEVISVAVNSGSNKEIQNYLNEHGFTFKVVNDQQSIYSSEFKIAAFPTTFIYDKNRNLVFSEVGYTSTIGLYFRMLWASL
ncbi:MAG: protein disulfide oxidoreductase [Epsilonproteobacteria bacterium]|nr:MAG: protein disulfide oxidoreductase [Campylobacterota bacterium]